MEIILAIIGILAVPWAGWTSLQLIDIKVTLHGNAEKLKEHDRRIEELEDLLPRHIPAT